jgi:hypothetical protein
MKDNILENGIGNERLRRARAAVELAGAFPVKGGDFVPIRKRGWFDQTKSAKGPDKPKIK